MAKWSDSTIESLIMNVFLAIPFGSCKTLIDGMIYAAVLHKQRIPSAID